MKIIVSMDERGGIWAHNEQGDMLAECFFKTDEETTEEIKAWGYSLLVHTYPAAQIEAGYGLEPQDLVELFLER
jgi:hypothetical protein